MAKEKNYIVWLEYRLTRQRQSENPKIKKLVTEVETWDTILPFSAKDDEEAQKTAKGFTSKAGGRSGGAEISVEAIWQVARRVC